MAHGVPEAMWHSLKNGFARTIFFCPIQDPMETFQQDPGFSDSAT